MLPETELPVEEILSVDREYRERAAAGELKLIAPRRFNPENKAWLPVLHTERDHWQFTAVFSNTFRAHALERTRDWVVLYFHTGSHPENQRTVVTERSGPLAGKRVVRGREGESLAAYGIPEMSHGTPRASSPARKRAPKTPPSVQNAVRPMKPLAK